METVEEMKQKICPMTIFLATPKPCIGGGCMMFKKQYKVEGVRGNNDIEFRSKFVGFYCALGNKRSKR